MKTIFDLIKQSFLNTPNKVAIRSELEVITYAELDGLSKRIAKSISKFDSDYVGIYMTHSLEYIVSIIAVMRCGKTIVPLNPQFPQKRIQDCIDFIGISQVLVRTNKPDLNFKNTIKYHDLISDDCEMKEIKSENTVFSINFTSGTTGKPKAIQITNESVSNMIDWQLKDFSSPNVVMQYAAIGFDVAYQEIFTAFCSGGELIIIPTNHRNRPDLVIQYVEQFNVNRLFLPTVILSHIAKEIRHSNYSLKVQDIIVAGEALILNQEVRNLISHGYKVWNHYGPAETLVATKCLIEADSISKAPIGRAVPNVSLFILNEKGEECRQDEEGEIFIQGIQNTIGYFNNPQANEKALINHKVFGQLYRTGDIGSLNSTGTYLINGRIDHEVKISGFRVNLLEISSKINEIEGVKDSRCVFDNKKLYAFLIMDKSIDTNQVDQHLNNTLPPYMLPNKLIEIEKVPMTTNGKTNRDELIKIATNKPAAVPRKSKADKIIHKIQELLDRNEIDTKKSLTQLGMTSLRILELHNFIEDRLEIDISLAALFSAKTIESFLWGKEDEAQNTSRHTEKKSANSPKKKVAITGININLKDVDSLDAFWDILISGLETPYIERINKNKFNLINAFSDSANFDAQFFNLTENEALNLDPQKRKLLESCYHAIEDAGYHPNDLVDSSVFVGEGYNTHLINNLLATKESPFFPLEDAESLSITIGNFTEFAPTLLSSTFGFQGESINIQTACSTGISCLHFARRCIENKDSTTAIVAVSTISSPEVPLFSYQDGMVYSIDGHTRPFIKESTGTVFGDGVITLVLKDYDLAIQDGDNIYCKLSSTAIVNDGGNKQSFAAPNKNGQVRSYLKLFHTGNIDPNDVDYIECHGTGTVIGDSIEIEAIKDVFKQKENILIGSVKSNIGHLGHLAGLAGVVKSALILNKKIIPSTINIKGKAKNRSLANSNITVVEDDIKFDKIKNIVVNSLGLGGTNATALLSSPEPYNLSLNIDSDIDHSMKLSAKSKYSLLKLASKYLDELTENKDIREIVTKSKLHANIGDYRLIASGSNKHDLIHSLTNAHVFHGPSRQVALCFTGQGVQYNGMAKTLYETFDYFTNSIDECISLLSSYDTKLAHSIKSLLLNKSEDDRIYDISFSQLCLFIYQYSLCKLLLSFNLKVDSVIGHSLGEISAACCAGIISIKDALSIVIERSSQMSKCRGGAMLTVFGSHKKLKSFVDDCEADVWLATKTSQNISTLSCKEEDEEKMFAGLKEVGLEAKKVNVNVAGHSPLLHLVSRQMARLLRKIQMNESKFNFHSSMNLNIYKNNILPTDYFADQIVNPVLFSDAMNLITKQDTLLIEVSPKPFISLAYQSELEGTKSSFLPLPITSENEEDFNFLHELSWVVGQERSKKRILRKHHKSIINYPFDHFKYNTTQHGYLKTTWIKPKTTEDVPQFLLVLKSGDSDFIDEFSHLKALSEHPNAIVKKVNSYKQNIGIDAQTVLIIPSVFTSEQDGLNTSEKITELSFELKSLILNNSLTDKHLLVLIPETKGFVDNNLAVLQAAKGFLKTSVLEGLARGVSVVDFNPNSHIDLVLKITNSNKYNEYRIIKADLQKKQLAVAESLKLQFVGFESESIVIIAGASRGIGLKLALYFIYNKINSVIALGRSAPSKKLQDMLNQHKKHFEYYQVDLTDKTAVNSFFKTVDTKELPVSAIINTSVHLNDELIINQSRYDFYETISSKVEVFENIISTLKGLDISPCHILNFTSASGLFGNIGQSSYASACQYLDYVSENLKLKDTIIKSISWGVWGDTGYLKKHKEIKHELLNRGYLPFSFSDGLLAMGTFLKNSYAHQLYIPMDLDRLKRTKLTKIGMLDSLVNEKRFEITQQESPSLKLVSKTITTVVDEVREYLSSEFNVDIEAVDEEQSFLELGINSLSRLKLKSSLSEISGLDIPMSSFGANSKILEPLIFIQANFSREEKSPSYDQELSFQQQRWLELVALNGYGCRVLPILFKEKLEPKKLNESVKRVVSKHQLLRYCYPELKQIKTLEVNNCLTDIENFLFPEPDQASITIASEFVRLIELVVDYENESSWKYSVIGLKNQFVMLVRLTHLEMDGSSLSLFAKDVGDEYRRLLDGIDTKMNDCMQYHEFTVIQNKKLENTKQLASLFYNTMFAGVDQVPDVKENSTYAQGLPLDSTRVSFCNSQTLDSDISQLCHCFQCDKFSLLLSIYAKALGAAFNIDNVVINFVMNARKSSAFDSIIGPFTYRLPIYVTNLKRNTATIAKETEERLTLLAELGDVDTSVLISELNCFKNHSKPTYFSDFSINLTNYEKSENDSLSNLEIIDTIHETNHDLFKGIDSSGIENITGIHLLVDINSTEFKSSFRYQKDRYSKNDVDQLGQEFIKLCTIKSEKSIH